MEFNDFFWIIDTYYTLQLSKAIAGYWLAKNFSVCKITNCLKVFMSAKKLLHLPDTAALQRLVSNDKQQNDWSVWFLWCSSLVHICSQRLSFFLWSQNFKISPQLSLESSASAPPETFIWREFSNAAEVSNSSWHISKGISCEISCMVPDFFRNTVTTMSSIFLKTWA